jgi:hypothetical protein
MERALNISGTYWGPNVVDQDAAFAAMQDLVTKGIFSIISITWSSLFYFE